MTAGKIVQVVAASSSAIGPDGHLVSSQDVYVLMEDGTLYRQDQRVTTGQDLWIRVDPPIRGVNIRPAYDEQPGNWGKWRDEGKVPK